MTLTIKKAVRKFKRNLSDLEADTQKRTETVKSEIEIKLTEGIVSQTDNKLEIDNLKEKVTLIETETAKWIDSLKGRVTLLETKVALFQKEVSK